MSSRNVVALSRNGITNERIAGSLVVTGNLLYQNFSPGDSCSASEGGTGTGGQVPVGVGVLTEGGEENFGLAGLALSRRCKAA